MLGTGVAAVLGALHLALVLLRVDEAFAHSTLVLGIIFQLLTPMVGHESSHKDGDEACRNAGQDDGAQLDALTTQQILRDDGSSSSRYGTTSDAQRSGHGGQGYGAFWTNLVGLCNLRNDGKQRIAGVCSAGHKAEEPRAERAVIGDVVGVLAQELGCLSDKPVQAASRLQGS